MENFGMSIVTFQTEVAKLHCLRKTAIEFERLHQN